MNTTVAVAEIASRTLICLAAIGAGVKVTLAIVPRLQITTPRGQGRAQAAGPPAVSVVEEHDGRGAA